MVHPRHVLHLGNVGPHELHCLVAAVLASGLEQAFPICNRLRKATVGWLHSTMWRHYPQCLILFSSLGRCSHADSIVHLRSVTACREHGIHCIAFPQRMVHWNEGEPRRIGVELITLARWRQRWPIGVNLHGCYGWRYPWQRYGITWRGQRSWWRHHYLRCLSRGPCIATRR